MAIPKINGRVDTEMLADIIVTHVLLESIVKYHGTRVSNADKNNLEKYVKELLDDILKEE